MTEIYEKRGRWCLRDSSGNLQKFNTELEAKEFLGYKEPSDECEDCECDPCECEDCECEDCECDPCECEED
jgi:hypothetical protein